MSCAQAPNNGGGRTDGQTGAVNEHVTEMLAVGNGHELLPLLTGARWAARPEAEAGMQCVCGAQATAAAACAVDSETANVCLRHHTGARGRWSAPSCARAPLCGI
jgi:hypothetical protein